MISLSDLTYDQLKVHKQSVLVRFHVFTQYVVHRTLIPFAKVLEIINHIRIKTQGKLLFVAGPAYMSVFEKIITHFRNI